MNLCALVYCIQNCCMVVAVVGVVVVVVVAFSSLRGFLGEGSAIHYLPVHFFFIKWISVHAQKFHSLLQDQSTVAR